RRSRRGPEGQRLSSGDSSERVRGAGERGERVLALEAQAMRAAAEGLRQRDREPFLARRQPPGNRFALQEFLANLGSRPGALLRASAPLEHFRSSLRGPEEPVR